LFAKAGFDEHAVIVFADLVIVRRHRPDQRVVAVVNIKTGGAFTRLFERSGQLVVS
jgi:hypothetical protein